MKVRCIDDLGTTILEVGSIYKGELKFNHWYNEKRWYLEGEKFRKFCFREKAFEIVEEDNNMQEKTFREVIATIKEGEVWESPHIRIYHVKSNDNIVIEDKEGDSVYRFTMVSEVKFRLKRKEYTFEEAFKAHEEGKVIESCYSQYKYKRANGVDLYSRTENNWYEDDNFEIDEIRGKWYINN